ncbi:MAG: terminase small subunit, partial [Treponema sp.]|nr:terminase small subunit [Treponema sp.]
MPRAKKTETPEEKKQPKGQINTLPDGSILDLSTLPVGDIKLTDRERKFIFWYTFPGTDAFQHQTRAAVMAGYKKENAFVQGCQIRQKEHISAAIKKIMDSKVKADLEEEYHKIIELKKRRIHYDVG